MSSSSPPSKRARLDAFPPPDAPLSVPAPSASASSSSVSSFADLLLSLSDHDPLIPDSLVSYFLSSSGCDLVSGPSSPLLHRLIGLAAEKFLFDIAQTAKIQAKIRTENGQSQPITLTMADLNGALRSVGSSALAGKFDLLVDSAASENEKRSSLIAKSRNKSSNEGKEERKL
jgi:hypothetical protein